MSNLKNVFVALVVWSVVMVTPAFPQGSAGCKTGKFVGSYIHADAVPDVWGDGTNVAHQIVTQLNLHSDGTVTYDFAGAPDVMLSFGYATSLVGSWTCRNDGMLVVTVIFDNYFPTTDAINHPLTVPAPPPVDLLLGAHVRRTDLFSVTDANTLTSIMRRSRVYDPAQDPTDPTGGVLLRLSTAVRVYKRVVASDADLLAP